MIKRELKSFLIVQTAYPGDVILTLPLIQVLKKEYPDSTIDVMVILKCADILANHPSINEVIIYDKHGSDAGLLKFAGMVKEVRKKKYDCAFVPHKSIRSALLVKFAGIPERIGFIKSSGKLFYSRRMPYQESAHEIERNCSLLKAIGIDPQHKEFPQIFPNFHDKKKVSHYLSEHGIQHVNNLIGVAPGTVWPTKQWPLERYIQLVEMLSSNGFPVVLIGGKEDTDICERIKNEIGSKSVSSSAGKLSLLQSGELIHRCKLLVSNDSAPMHLAGAMRTPVIAIFGATIPEFGFAPYGELDVVVETKGLTCRPCSIHGGYRCPIKTFDCMNQISVHTVYKEVLKLFSKKYIKADDNVT
jgi:lipopolysaccharide heptosyltransferase II